MSGGEYKVTIPYGHRQTQRREACDCPEIPLEAAIKDIERFMT